MCFTLSVNLYKTQLFAPSFTNDSFISGRKFCLQVRINLWSQLCNREEITSGLLESLGFSWRAFGAVSWDPDCWGSYTPDCRTESTSTFLMYILTGKGDISAVSWDPDCWGNYSEDCRLEPTSTCLMYILTGKGDISAVSFDPDCWETNLRLQKRSTSTCLICRFVQSKVTSMQSCVIMTTGESALKTSKLSQHEYA